MGLGHLKCTSVPAVAVEVRVDTEVAVLVAMGVVVSVAVAVSVCVCVGIRVGVWVFAWSTVWPSRFLVGRIGSDLVPLSRQHLDIGARVALLLSLNRPCV